MPRTTRKHEPRRQLRRTQRARASHAVVQSGGAAWYKFSDVRRTPIWQEVLGTSPLNFVATEWRTSPDAMKRYGIILARQDELMTAARRCMMRSAGIDETTPATEVLTKIQTADRGFLNDVLALVAFSDEGPRTSKDTKIVDLSNNLLDCVLFPKRVENLLVYAIASLIVRFHKEPELLQEARRAPELRAILVRQCRTYYRQLVYEQTAAEPTDTFYMRQTLANATTDRNTFWGNFINRCMDAPPSSNNRIPAIDFYQIAAGIYHNRTAADIVSAVFMALKGPVKDATILSFTAAPDSGVWENKVIDDIKYKDFLLDGYRPRHIEFLFHLAYTVQKILTEEGNAAAAPATAPSTS
jgi:hypothetical protein